MTDETCVISHSTLVNLVGGGWIRRGVCCHNISIGEATSGKVSEFGNCVAASEWHEDSKPVVLVVSVV